MKQNNTLTFKIEYNNYDDYTRIAAEINDRFVIYVASYPGKPDEWRNEDEISAYKDRTLTLNSILSNLKQAVDQIDYYKNEANDETRDDACIIALHNINHIVEHLKQKFQYDDDVARILYDEYLTKQNTIKRFDLILDNWKALAIDQMQKTNPITFAKSVYEFEELDENEIKELLYEMYNVYIAKLNND
jgi:hypothetical protein